MTDATYVATETCAQNPPRWTQEQDDTLRRMRRSGVMFPAIAARLGKTEKSLRHRAEAIGITKKRLLPTSEVIEQVRKMTEMGMTRLAIGRAVGVSRSAISGMMYRAGIYANTKARQLGYRLPAELAAATRLQVVQLAKDGKTKAEIREALGISQDLLRRYLKKEGMRLKSGQPRKHINWIKREGPTKLQRVPVIPAGDDNLIPMEQRKTFAALEVHQCRWPVGEPGVDLFFCGADRLDAYPYCAGHCQRAYRADAR